MRLLPALLLVFFFSPCNALFGKKHLNILKEKAKNYYKSKFSKKGLNFLGYDLSEYPGANKKYRKENIDKWNEYYDCLKAQKENLGPHRSFTPEAILGFEGGSVKFECKVCMSPKERDKMELVEWQSGSINAKYLVPLEFNEHIYASPSDKTLHIYNLKEENSGQYLCRIGLTLMAPYYLTVVKTSENMTEVHHRAAPQGPYPSPLHILNHRINLKLDTVWGDWSPCSRCGRAGKRHRFGYCIINMSSSSHKIKKTNEMENSVSTEVPGILRKRPQEITLPKNYTELIEIFQNGIPCLSHILPDSIKNMFDVKSRVGEIMTGYCKVPCPNPKIFEVKDKSGKVLETANNSAGIYSMMQPIPPSEPSVTRTVEYHGNGDDIKLSCPGNLNNDALIQWQIGSKNVIPELIATESGGRIYVSLTEKLHIKNAKIADTNIYSCWQDKELAGSIRLIIEKKIRMNFNHHIMLFGIVIILSTFLYVFVKAFLGRKYAKIDSPQLRHSA